ncbi:MAG: hypothetical protein AVDCRST_MAG52-3102 [uncultured Blastococcus sp.]|uniref:Uncharacterized protein n=1 Tax=uncultured Blastococcus sp. TaxID=217144 RepID=A0A6J4J301_9ACTN|nr:MAG: hypothetical protein AVDCRST_MAG52-3102 [uncultured Blastococcus sp.]
MHPTAKPLLGPRAAGVYALLLLVLAAGSAFAAAFSLVVAVSRDAADVSVHLSDRVRLDLNGRLDLPEGATLLGGPIPVRLHVPDLPLGLRLVAQADDVLLYLSIAAGATALALVLRAVRRGLPFARRNARCLVAVAVAVVVGGGIAPVVGDHGAGLALNHLAGLDGQIVLAASSSLVLPAVLGIVILGIAEAFRRGAALTDDMADRTREPASPAERGRKVGGDR